MLNLNKITCFLLFIMLFSPLLSYFTFGLLGLVSIIYYFQVIFCFYGLLFLIKRRARIRLEAIHYFFTGYVLYLITWSFYNGFFDQKGFLNSTNLRYFSTIVILIIIYNTEFSFKYIERIVLVIKITVVLAGLVSLIQVIDYSFLDANPIWAKGEIGDTLTGNLYLDRRGSIFGYINPNEVGLSYMPLLSVLIGILLYRRYRFYYFFLLLGGITAVLSNGRYIMIAFLIIGFQVLVFQEKKFMGIVKYVLLSAFSLFVLYQILIFFGYNIDEWISARLLSEGSIAETTRYKAIGNFVKFFPRAPFFGIGTHMTQEIKDASSAIGSSQIHVGYLAHLVSYGIVGSFFLFGFWYLLAKKLYKTAKLTNYWGSFFAFLIYLWAQATLVDYSIFYYGLLFAFIFDKYFMDSFKMPLKRVEVVDLKNPKMSMGYPQNQFL